MYLAAGKTTKASKLLCGRCVDTLEGPSQKTKGNHNEGLGVVKDVNTVRADSSSGIISKKGLIVSNGPSVPLGFMSQLVLRKFPSRSTSFRGRLH